MNVYSYTLLYQYSPRVQSGDTMCHRANRARPLALTRIIAGGKLAIIAWQQGTFAGRETNKKEYALAYCAYMVWAPLVLLQQRGRKELKSGGAK